MVTDVTDYGAAGDGSTDDTQAIRDAADAAGAGGTVYFPAGTYLVGSNTRIPLSYPGDGSWDDIAWVGEDYSTTTIRMSGEDYGKSYFLFYFGNGTVTGGTWRNLTFDGNKSANSTADAGQCWNTANQGTGNFRWEDCVIEEWHGGALKPEGDEDVTITRCSFLNNGFIDNAGHAISTNQQSPSTTNISYCLFEGTGGSDIDVGLADTDNGYVTCNVDHCIIRGSRGAFKVNPENVKTTVSNTRMVGVTRTTMAGMKANSNNGNCGSMEFRECVIENGTWPGIDIASGDFDTLLLDQVAIKNPDGDSMRGAGIYTQDTSLGTSGTISVHNVGPNDDGDAIKFDEGTNGSIDEVIYGGTSSPGGWRTDGVSIGTTTQGTPLSPNVPSESEVGPQSSSSSTSDDGSTTDDSTSYGGYKTPEAGTLDWHEPLNENFTNIEADILDIAKRLDNLENS